MEEGFDLFVEGGFAGVVEAEEDYGVFWEGGGLVWVGSWGWGEGGRREGGETFFAGCEPVEAFC